MKKLFLTLVLIIVSSTVFSQITINPGVRAGVNFANITNTEFNDKTDFYMGAFAQIKFVHFYALQPELTYTRQGGASRFSSDMDLEIQYLSLSVANKFSPFKDVGLNFIIGPAINIKTGDNYNDANNELEDFDIVFFGGLGYEFPFGLTLEARYNIGLVDIFGSNINEDAYVDDILLNKVIQVGVAYKFNL